MPILMWLSILFGITFLMIALVSSSVMSTASAQAPPSGIFPGDPVSEADKVFVSLDTSRDATCGVTTANNIRCWGDNGFAPMWAGGFKDVAVGRAHTCGLKLDSTVQCWGRNRFGYNLLSPPTDNGSPIKFKSIDSNSFHTCGIRDDDASVVCWGSDSSGQVSGSSTFFLDVSYDFSNDSFSKISPASNHTCGLIIIENGGNGTNVRCWGSGSGEGRPSTVPTAYSSTVFKDIDAGSSFTCGLIDGGADDGKAVCWGIGSGIIQTPIGTFGSDLQISVPSIDRFTKISSGGHHVCGIKTDATISCWGATKASGVAQAYGQADVPIEHQSSTFSDVVSAQYHTCAILDGQNGQVEGKVVCWGSEIPYDPLSPHLVAGGRVFDPDRPYPPPHRFPQIASGVDFNCGLSADRDLVCWGGSTFSPSIVDGPFKALDMGERHVCAVRDSGHINCWGYDNNLQASGWTRFFSPDFAPSLYYVTQAVENLTTDYTFKSVSASYFHTCGILDGRTAGQTDGSVICWGHKTNGQATPPEGMTFSFISAGWYHTCGLLNDHNGQFAGKAVCWGAENNLDDDGNVVPTLLNYDDKADFGQADIPDELQDVVFSSITASRYHTCGIRADNGQIECWGRSDWSELPDNLAEESFSAVANSWYSTCGITSKSLVKCWGSDTSTARQFRIPTDYVETRFVAISVGQRHACATKEDGTVICWGADADLSTPQIEIYRAHSTVPDAFTIINTRQAWVPREFRASPINPPLPPTPRPAASIKILRIEPDIRGVSLRVGAQARLDLEVYGRQDIRDDPLGDRPDVTFDWTVEDTTSSDRGDFQEVVHNSDDRDSNGEPDDRRVVHVAPSEPGTYVVKAALDAGTECMPRLDGETEADAVDRCTAVFEITVRGRPPVQPPPELPRNPSGEIPSVIVDDSGTNYEVFTPEGGGEFVTEKCSFRAPESSVNNNEVIGISITELEMPEERVEVADPRFATEGIQCRIDAVGTDGTPSTDYRLRKAGDVCILLPDVFRPKATDAIVGSINVDATLTALSSKLYLANSGGELKVCGALSSLSATITVALHAEAVGELPPTPIASPDVAEIETGGSRLPEHLWLMAMLLGFVVIVAAVWTMFRKRGTSTSASRLAR